MKCSVFFVAILGVLTSCLSHTSFLKTLPPKIKLPEEHEHIMLVNAYDTTRLDFNQDKKIHVFSIGSQEVFHALERDFKERLPLTVLIADTSVKRSLFTENIDFIQTLCRQEKAPLLLVLSSYDLDFDQEVDVEKNDDGSKSRTAYYDLITKVEIILYDSTGQVIDRSEIKKVYENYDTRSVVSGLLAVGPSMGNADKEVLQLSHEVAIEYVDQFFPSTLTIVKFVYFQKEVREGAKALTLGNWQEAIDLLKPKTSSSHKKTAGRAAYNLSVAYEAMNNLDAASYWYDQAVQKLGAGRLPYSTDGF